MAVFSIADMSAALPSVYPRMISQVQRKAVLLRLLSQLGGLKRGMTGNSMTWNVKFSGQDAGAVNLDGGGFRTAASDVPVAASLSYGSYEAPVKVTDRMLKAGGANGGLGSDINSLYAPVEENIKDAIEAWVKLVNQHLYSGSGSSNQMVGLYSAIVASGTYANISASTYSGWASTVAGNSGTLRSLTLGLIKTQLRTIAANSAMGRPDLAICPPSIMDAVEALFDAYIQVPAPIASGPAPGSERIDLNPAMIRTAGGDIRADGFRVFYWANQRLWFVEDPDCTYPGITNVNNVMYLLNSQDIEVDYIPPVGQSMFAPSMQAVQAAEQGMGPLAVMPLEMIPRGRTQHAIEMDINGIIGVRVNSRNAHGCLQDIQ